MGLAEPRKRRKISQDPNNTHWSSNTTNYGHKILTSQGWTPGSHLGVRDAPHAGLHSVASYSHIRVALKEDTLGLGAKLGGGGLNGERTGLDALQSLLGRLNGKSEVELSKEQLARASLRRGEYVGNRVGAMTFVKGGWLVGDQISMEREVEEEKSEQTEGMREEKLEMQEQKKKDKEERKRLKQERREKRERKAKRKLEKSQEPVGEIDTTMAVPKTQATESGLDDPLNVVAAANAPSLSSSTEPPNPTQPTETSQVQTKPSNKRAFKQSYAALRETKAAEAGADEEKKKKSRKGAFKQACRQARAARRAEKKVKRAAEEAERQRLIAAGLAPPVRPKKRLPSQPMMEGTTKDPHAARLKALAEAAKLEASGAVATTPTATTVAASTTATTATTTATTTGGAKGEPAGGNLCGVRVSANAATGANTTTAGSKGRALLRQRSIQNKKMAVTDQKALNEVRGF